MFLAFAYVFYRKSRFRRYLAGYCRTSYNRKDFTTLNRMGWLVGIQMGLETALFSISGIMIGWLGTVELAAHQVVASISTLGYTVYYGVGAAVSIRVSKYFGPRHRCHLHFIARSHHFSLFINHYSCVLSIRRCLANHLCQFFTRCVGCYLHGHYLLHRLFRNRFANVLPLWFSSRRRHQRHLDRIPCRVDAYRHYALRPVLPLPTKKESPDKTQNPMLIETKQEVTPVEVPPVCPFNTNHATSSCILNTDFLSRLFLQK